MSGYIHAPGCERTPYGWKCLGGCPVFAEQMRRAREAAAAEDAERQAEHAPGCRRDGCIGGCIVVADRRETEPQDARCELPPGHPGDHDADPSNFDPGKGRCGFVARAVAPLGRRLRARALSLENQARTGSVVVSAASGREIAALLREAADAHAEMADEIATDDRLLADRQRILDACPCPVHGACVPYVLEALEMLRCPKRPCGSCGAEAGDPCMLDCEYFPAVPLRKDLARGEMAVTSGDTEDSGRSAPGSDDATDQPRPEGGAVACRREGPEAGAEHVDRGAARTVRNETAHGAARAGVPASSTCAQPGRVDAGSDPQPIPRFATHGRFTFRREGPNEVCVDCGWAREGTISWAMRHERHHAELAADPQPGEVWEDSEDGEQVRVVRVVEGSPGGFDCVVVHPADRRCSTPERAFRFILPSRWRRISVPWSAEVSAKLAPDGTVHIDPETFEREVRTGIERSVRAAVHRAVPPESLRGLPPGFHPEVLHRAAQELRALVRADDLLDDARSDLADAEERLRKVEAERDVAREKQANAEATVAEDTRRLLRIMKICGVDRDPVEAVEALRAERDAARAELEAMRQAKRDAEHSAAFAGTSGPTCTTCNGVAGRYFVSDARPWKRTCEACGARNLVPEWAGCDG